MTELIKGTYNDIITDPHGRTIWSSGWRPNLIVNSCNVLLAALMKRDTNMQGSLYMAVGDGSSDWDGERPEPLPTDTHLANEVTRVEVSERQIIYLDGYIPGNTPTSRLEITAVFKFDSDKTLREFGLFGGNATEERDSGYMIDYVIHPKFNLTAGMTLTRKVRLSFGGGGARRKEPAGFGANLHVLSIDGVGPGYGSILNINNIQTLFELAQMKSSIYAGYIPEGKLREFKAKAKMLMRLEIEPEDFAPLANRKLSVLLSERPEKLAKETGIPLDVINYLQEELSMLYIVMDDEHLQQITFGQLIKSRRS